MAVPEVRQPQTNFGDKFVHPYDDKSWLWQFCFRTKRFFFLFAVFLPCMTVAGLGKLTGSQDLRAFGLDLLVEALNFAGCGMQKFGQWLSMRPDMVPADVVAALSSLRSDVPAHHIRHTRKMIVESFGSELEEVFEQFDETPVASGTVAQVHRARLREEFAEKANIRGPNGKLIRDIAVKVRHPDVLAEMWCDIEMMYELMARTRLVCVPVAKTELIENLRRQIDFTWEARNLVQFAQNFKSEVKNGMLRFPIVSVDMLSSCVLLESWADGKTVGSIFNDVGDGFSVVEATKSAMHKVDVLKDGFVGSMAQTRRKMASTLFDMSIKMFLRDNLVHGDLHSGNVLFDNEGKFCTVIDGGLTTKLEDVVRNDFIKFLKALCTADTEAMVQHLIDFEVEGKTVDVEQALSRQQLLQVDVQHAVDTLVGDAGEPMCLGDLLGSILFSLQKHDILLRGDVASALMTMGVTEGLVRSIDPDFDMVREAQPYFLRYANLQL